MKTITMLLLIALAFSMSLVSWNGSDESHGHSYRELTRTLLPQERRVTIDQGAIIRGDSTRKNVALVFTGDEYFEGLPVIAKTLKQHNVKGGFFFTGNLYANKHAENAIRTLFANGHYLGPHSDKHLLYNDWARRDSLLVTRDSLLRDIRANYEKMEVLGIRHERKLFIPPFEWWNTTNARWLNEEGIQVISFTWGIPTNADYTTPDMGPRYRSNETIMAELFKAEATGRLKGAIILIHAGTDPRRKEKLYNHLGTIVQKLKAKGYQFDRVDRLLE